MLLQGDLVTYLLERGLLRTDRVVGGDLIIQDVSRRNRNFKVLQDSGPCYFLKQAATADARTTVSREAAVLRYLASLPGSRRLAPYLPALSDYDDRSHVLILRMARGSVTADEYVARRGRFPRSAGSALGTFFGALHRATTEDSDRVEREWSTRAPWVLEVHQPKVPFYWGASEANLSLIRIIQEFPQLRDSLDDLRGQWRTECLVHGDLKFANVVIDGTPGRKGAVQVIDWELAGFGDPAWDIGSIWSDTLCLWLLSLPMAQDTSIERSLQVAPFPLTRMAPALQSFWERYVEERGLDPTEAESFLFRSVSYGAARLLQSAVESMVQAPRITTNVVYLIQLSSNMMRRPDSAASDLLGLAS